MSAHTDDVRITATGTPVRQNKEYEMNASTAGSAHGASDEQPQQTDDSAADAGSESPEEGAAAMEDAEDAVVNEGD